MQNNSVLLKIHGFGQIYIMLVDNYM